MTRRFLAVLFVAVAALAALAILLTLTTRGEEPLSDAAIPASWSAAPVEEDGLPRFEAPGGQPADATSSDTTGLDPAGRSSRPLLELATVRIEVNESAQRATPVSAELNPEGGPDRALRATIGEAQEWTVRPGRWDLRLAGSG